MVGAIHGRLLTAWTTAGVLGPVVVNYMREYQLGLGIPRAQVYNQTIYILVGMLVVGLICNLLVRLLDKKWFMTDTELAVNQYGVLAVNPALHPNVNVTGAQKFVDWVTGAAGQAAIASYNIGGEPLFFPNAKP